MDLANNIYSFECIILGVINSYLWEKYNTQFYDWTLIKQCNRDIKDINELKVKDESIENIVKELSNEIKNINSKLNVMNSQLINCINFQKKKQS